MEAAQSIKIDSDELMILLEHVLDDIVISVAKSADAPASSAVHIDKAIATLQSILPKWTANNSEIAKIVNDAIIHMEMLHMGNVTSNNL
jgi:hypothetical protein